MFAHCADPKSLEGFAWLMCYLTSGKHMLFYASFGTVLLLLMVTAPVALLFGFGGAMAARCCWTSRPARWIPNCNKRWSGSSRIWPPNIAPCCW